MQGMTLAQIVPAKETIRLWTAMWRKSYRMQLEDVAQENIAGRHFELFLNLLPARAIYFGW